MMFYDLPNVPVDDLINLERAMPLVTNFTMVMYPTDSYQQLRYTLPFTFSMQHECSFNFAVHYARTTEHVRVDFDSIIKFSERNSFVNYEFSVRYLDLSESNCTVT